MCSLQEHIERERRERAKTPLYYQAQAATERKAGDVEKGAGFLAQQTPQRSG